jgi:hypothetical protein
MKEQQNKNPLKKLLSIILVLTCFLAKAQTINEVYLKTFDDLKSKSTVDKNDKASLEIINDFYFDVLQSDKGELGSSTINKLQKFMASPNAKNKYLVEIFLMYLQHISETAAKNLKTNADFQVAAMKKLKIDFQELYGLTPPIIFIYGSEALENAQRIEEAKKEVVDGLNIYPNSIPLKVYHYLGTKNEEIKKDLITNHPNHWLVIQSIIK